MATPTVARPSGYSTPETQFYAPPSGLDRRHRGPVIRSQPQRPPTSSDAPAQPSDSSIITVLNRLLSSQAITGILVHLLSH